ncbi:hypothetical protein CROQUDRAFT_135410 [Cronartium quercuum f. sp. fusiforme G11]|uniref:Uncharacterized protein n=1 Tax=Cronartium quercuum f. sp. fusiforme G11 TaxID=708437 RepID=A0A9P6NB61_9BASI|nr:hypothetical protein CROQUDRAFT_135410 [Cronartium quercuum f. sp. fusiforme G11]
MVPEEKYSVMSPIRIANAALNVGTFLIILLTVNHWITAGKLSQTENQVEDLKNSVLWEDYNQRTWRDMKNMELATTQNKLKTDSVRNAATMKNTILDHYGQLGPNAYRENHPENEASTAWAEILKPFIDIMTINSNPGIIHILKQLQTQILRYNPFNLSLLSHDKEGIYTLVAYVSYVLEQLRTYLFSTRLQKVFTASNSIGYGLQRFIDHLADSKVTNPRTFYGEAYDHYMSFVDMVEHCLVAGYKSRKAITKARVSSPSEENRFSFGQNVFRGEGKINGFEAMHKTIFKTGSHTKFLAHDLSNLIFVEPFLDLKLGPKEAIKKQLKTNCYLASQRNLSFAAQLQGFTSGNLELNTIVPRRLDHLQGWKTFVQKCNTQDPCDSKLAPIIETIYSLSYKHIVGNRNSQFTLDAVLNSLFKHMKVSQSKEVTIDEVINSVMFVLLLKELSSTLTQAIRLTSKDNHDKLDFPITRCIALYNYCLTNASASYAQSRKRKGYVEHKEGMPREFGRRYRIYLLLSLQFKGLGEKLESSNLVREDFIKNNVHLKEILSIDKSKKMILKFSPKNKRKKSSTLKSSTNSQPKHTSSEIEMVETNPPVRGKRKSRPQHFEDQSKLRYHSNVNGKQLEPSDCVNKKPKKDNLGLKNLEHASPGLPPRYKTRALSRILSESTASSQVQNSVITSSWPLRNWPTRKRTYRLLVENQSDDLSEGRNTMVNPHIPEVPFDTDQNTVKGVFLPDKNPTNSLPLETPNEAKNELIPSETPEQDVSFHPETHGTQEPNPSPNSSTDGRGGDGDRPQQENVIRLFGVNIFE